MSDLDIFPPIRPTATSRGSTYFHTKVRDPETEDQYDHLGRCIICGTLNKEDNTECILCESKNLWGEYS